jgi:hypothetical protein
LKVTVTYLKKLIDDGEIPYIVIQGTEMIRLWDLIEYIEKNLKRHEARAVREAIDKAARGEL